MGNRVEISKRSDMVDFPNLVGVQLKSYREFLQEGVEPDKRQQIGLKAIFESVFPIVCDNEGIALEFVDYVLDPPRYSIPEVRERDVTYAAALKAIVRLVYLKTGEIKEQEVFMGDLPIMTPEATFIINGAERVIVSQLHRSPGIFFQFSEKDNAYTTKIIPNRGSWLEFELGEGAVIYLRIDKKKKISVTTILRCLGYSTNEDILRLVYNTEKVTVPTEDTIREGNDIELQNIIGRRIAHDILGENGAALVEAGDILNSDVLERISHRGTETIELVDTGGLGGDITIINCIEKDDTRSREEALLKIFSVVRPGDPITVENAEQAFRDMFFNPKRYNLGKVGRYMINKKFGFDVNEDSVALREEDIVQTVLYLIKLKIGKGERDDIDNLGNRRVRSVGELLVNHLKVGFTRMERIIHERVSIQDTSLLTPQSLINIKPITAAINEFFGTSQLSQFMDQVNPLSGLTHKRRLSALGPGGLSRERAGFEVRDVHHSHYGRLCTIETPEGPNIGLIASLPTLAGLNEYGFLEAPYRKVIDGRVTEEVVYLTSDVEDESFIAPSHIPVDKEGKITDDLVPVRIKGDYPMVDAQRVNYVDVSPIQIFSVSTSLVPFLEHDDANRALMGSNMMRQAVPLLTLDSPAVGTGMEAEAARYSGVVICSEEDGTVEGVTNRMVSVKTKAGKVHEYPLRKFDRSNQGTCINQRPIVDVGQKVKAGDFLCDGPAIDHGELALGKNTIVALMSWEGYNFEDAIIVSERIVKDDLFTSVHIEKFEVEAREMKLGKEMITRDIPNLSEDVLSHLDEEGKVCIGTEVGTGDILVGKVTPKGETDTSPEYKLLHSIFGEKAKEVRDTSLRVPSGNRGTVISVRTYSRENGDDLAPGVDTLVKVEVAMKRKLCVGDKMAGRHGNKGVVSIVVPEEDMPYLPDGTPVDIILNPLGVPSRMNIGQLLECQLGLAAFHHGCKYTTPIFNSPSTEQIQALLEEKGVEKSGKSVLYDGKTGRPFESEITVGVMYMLKLSHMIEDKMHARSTGPYSLVTQQPLGGKSQFGGQRLGEMEVWALEAYGAANTLQELLTVKADDIIGRAKVYEAVVKGDNAIAPGVPESFNVLINELKGLCLDIRIHDGEGNEIDLSDRTETTLKRRTVRTKI